MPATPTIITIMIIATTMRTAIPIPITILTTTPTRTPTTRSGHAR